MNKDTEGLLDFLADDGVSKCLAALDKVEGKGNPFLRSLFATEEVEMDSLMLEDISLSTYSCCITGNEYAWDSPIDACLTRQPSDAMPALQDAA